MIKIGHLWLVFLPCFSSAQNIQELLKISEIDSEGKDHEIAKAPKIADINSEIQIIIDKDLLKKQAGQHMPEESQLAADSLLGQIEQLQGFLSDSLPLFLSQYEDAMRQWEQQSEEERDINRLRRELRPAARIVAQIVEYSYNYPLFNAQLNNTQETLIEENASLLEQWQAIFRTTETYLDGLQQQLKSILEKHSVTIQLGAWISTRSGTRPVHLPGFDNLQAEERQAVERFHLPPPAKQQEQIEHIGEIAKAYNSGGLQSVLKEQASSIRPRIDSLLAGVQEHMKKFEEETRSLAGGNDSRPPPSPDFVTNLNNLSNKIEPYKTFLDGLKNKYGQDGSHFASGVDLLAESIGDLTEFTERTHNLVQAVQRFQESVSNAPAGFQDFMGGLISYITSAERIGIPVVSILGSSSMNKSTYAFSKEVLKHGLDSLPSETRFSLLHAGRREEGDLLVIRLAVNTKNEPNGKTLERHDLRLHRVQFFVETKTAMAFVDHLAKTQEERKQFQLAPSYSLLFKWGSRNKVAFNQFWRPGIGFNIASPDLKLDEAPDIALSLTVSGINDWIQAGGGYNITGEAPYWFFGLRLPIISLAPTGLDTGAVPVPED